MSVHTLKVLHDFYLVLSDL